MSETPDGEQSSEESKTLYDADYPGPPVSDLIRSKEIEVHVGAEREELADEEDVMHTWVRYEDDRGRMRLGKDIPMVTYDRLEMKEVLYGGLCLSRKLEDGEEVHAGTLYLDPADPNHWEFFPTEVGEEAADRDKLQDCV